LSRLVWRPQGLQLQPAGARRVIVAPRRGVRLSSMKLPSRYGAFLTPLILSIFMSGIVSGVATAKSHGLEPGLVAAWISTWGTSWAIAFPVLLLVLPLVRQIVNALVDPPEAEHHARERIDRIATRYRA
jgi:hypothetical protein